jgi:hypothetical protein
MNVTRRNMAGKKEERNDITKTREVKRIGGA